MTLTELIAAFRDLADDTAEPYLWSDSVLTRFANEAQEEACRRGRLIVDSTTEEVCRIDVTAGTAVYPVDPRVLFMRRVKLDSMDMPIRKTSVEDLDLMSPGWEGELPGPPFVWAPYEIGKILLFPPPDVDDTMRLTVVRLPLAPPALQSLTPMGVTSISQANGVATAMLAAPSSIATGGFVVISGATPADYNGAHRVVVVGPSIVTFEVPEAAVSPATGTITYVLGEHPLEIPSRYHAKLVDWMLFRALSMRDKEERHDQDGAKAHLLMFEEEFGQRSSAVDETWIAHKHGFDPFEGLF